MIISINLSPEDVAKLDKMAGPRQRSAWIRKAINLHILFPSLIATAEIQRDIRALQRRERNIANGRKATTPRKKAA